MNTSLFDVPEKSAEQKEKALIETLLKRLDYGKNILAKGTINSFRARRWSINLRTELEKLYGKDTKIADSVPLYDKDAPEIKNQEIFEETVNKLESFINELRRVGVKTFCNNNAGKIFIGHGRSLLWHKLKDFLSERLRLTPDEFNIEAVAGITTFERLSEMLDEASFAFLIMTAEDEHSDFEHHARHNVIHELGLFQGRLGPRKAIILLEEGCQEFSNIVGLSHLPFPQNHISATFEKIREVLEREGVIKNLTPKSSRPKKPGG